MTTAEARTDSQLRSAARDVLAGAVVFVVALPLCVGVAIASGAPPAAGLIAGVVGGVLVGILSGSHTSVSGPAAGLVAVVAVEIRELGSFEAFLLAVVIAGLMQVALGCLSVGSVAGYFPSSVIKGFLAAIGIILILKQVPHLVGADADPEGEMSFRQPDDENTFSELAHLFDNSPVRGAALAGGLSLALLFASDRVPRLKRGPVPMPLVAVGVGVAVSELLRGVPGWEIARTHLVRVPQRELSGLLVSPDWSRWRDWDVYLAALAVAAVSSLETLLNLEAVGKLDPHQRPSPPNRELVAQGLGTAVSGLAGGLPLTALVVRGSSNVIAGARSKLATISHGLMLLGCLALTPGLVSRLPYACVAAVLIHTGSRLVWPLVSRRVWAGGVAQFVPFGVTILAVIFTDLLVGVVAGLAVAVAFILRANVGRPVRKTVERHPGGEVIRIELASQETFLNRAALQRALDAVPPGAHVLFDARATDTLDPDIRDLVRDFAGEVGPPRGVRVSLLGFRGAFHLEDRTEYVDVSTREVQSALTPDAALELLKAGHRRFSSRQTLTRDLRRQVHATAAGQHPIAAILGCIDSRVPAELIFDLGVGDIFSARVAGNVVSREILGSLEYACAVAGAKLVLVLGHTHCGAVDAAIDLHEAKKSAKEATGCDHLDEIVGDIQRVLESRPPRPVGAALDTKVQYATAVARANVTRSVARLTAESRTLAEMVNAGRIRVVGAVYDVASGEVTFLEGA